MHPKNLKIFLVTKNGPGYNKKNKKFESAMLDIHDGMHSPFYAKSREKYIEFVENKEKFEGKTQGNFYSGKRPLVFDRSIAFSSVLKRP